MTVRELPPPARSASEGPRWRFGLVVLNYPTGPVNLPSVPTCRAARSFRMKPSPFRSSPLSSKASAWFPSVKMASMAAALGQKAAALAAAEELAGLGRNPAEDTYNAAAVLARCVSDARPPEQARVYADGAVELLRRAAAKGFTDAARMSKDPELAPLRDRADFNKLLRELEDKAKMGCGQKSSSGRSK